MDKRFDLEYQYQLYLERVGLKESMMHPVQQKETRQAFMGACGQMLILMRDDVGELEENHAICVMQGMIDQVKGIFEG